MSQKERTVTGVVLDETAVLSLHEICHTCGVSAELVIEMVEEGVLEPEGPAPQDWRFRGSAVKRLQMALRLTRDLRVNLPGAALALELLDELDALRRLHSRSHEMHDPRETPEL
ncbi:MAG: MerR family transcriptional regulator [Gammaproteobacteria bacterium]|nr:MerR family transcriptional regulator [Gammaproteobacteria bacterium]NIR83996.1 MerR family transcriptional regulator [Gammaproteobacteria bacterium]NIR89140.1 MerR family transcriptional regulator [Gammaproteobacteria bacterium]NIU04942.1 MerR family transcriptional regulator [Gammaproteobacteria bacterium]NIV52108.1 MerR family transcriptional regulator [Gammaproteobacteria bacterium]